jgi:hypothetical protein
MEDMIGTLNTTLPATVALRRQRTGRESATETALELSWLFSATAMLFRCVDARRATEMRLERLSLKARELVMVLSDIADNNSKPAGWLPCRQLTLIQVWRTTLGSSERLAQLTSSAPQAVADVLAGQIDNNLLQHAETFEEAARTLSIYAGQLLAPRYWQRAEKI